jgi:hypothetical protein
LGYGAGISVVNGAGTVTVSNTGVLSFNAGTTGLTPATAITGNVTLSGTLIAANGGTGFASYAVGDILYANSTTTLAKLPDVATGNALISGGVNTAPSWGKIDLTIHVTGILPIANGGTNSNATPTAGAVAYGTGTAYSFSLAGTSGYFLKSGGTGSPTWSNSIGGYIVDGTAPYLDWGNGSAVTPVSGRMWFDNTTNQLNIQQGANVTQQIGEETFTYIRASAAITNGQVVARTGTDGTSGYVKAAPAPIGTTDPDAILGIATEDIANNGYGRITWFGVVHGLSTSPGFSDGDDLFYDPTVVGGYTKTKPSAPNMKLQVGTIIKAAGGTNGSIQVKLGASSVLGGTDSNVQFGTLATNDLIQYNGTYWTNVTPASVLAGAGGAPVTKTANFSVSNGDTWLINNKSGSTCTATLPAASSYSGRVLRFQNYQAQLLVSASSNVVPLVGGAAGTAILNAVAGDTCTLVSDGTNWLMTQYVPNNVLLLE